MNARPHPPTTKRDSVIEWALDHGYMVSLDLVRGVWAIEPKPQAARAMEIEREEREERAAQEAAA
jgi:hypothetical protein